MRATLPDSPFDRTCPDESRQTNGFIRQQPQENQ